MRKRLKSIVVLACMFLGLTGCDIEGYETPNEMKVRYMQTIMDSVIAQETEPIEELFCSYVRDTHPDLESEIVGLFNFIEGDIISYDAPRGTLGGGRRTPKEGIIEETMGAEVRNIKTSTGKTYSMGFGGYRIYNEHPEYVGITDMQIHDEDIYNSDNGYPEEGVFKVYCPEMWE